jgi:subtilisin family serine protease
MRQLPRFSRGIVLFPAAAAALTLAAAAPAHTPARAAMRPQHVRLIVKFTRSSTPAERRALLAASGARTLKEIAPLRIAVVRTTPATAAELAGAPDVAYTEPDHVAQAVTTPNDPYFNGSASPCVSSLGCWPYNNLHLPQAWDATTGSSSVIVAVVDSGVDGAHPDLAGAVLPGYNFVAGNTNAQDDNGHGTAVAGVIAARIDNGIGVPGVCGRCQILPVKVLGSTGSGSTSGVAQGITWAADHGARVINLSLASTYADPAMRDAISYAVGKGALVVVAAGNAGSSNPSTCNGGCGGYPAAFTTQISSGLISVGAADYYNNLYSFSNHGPWVLVSGPGAAITPVLGGGYNAPGGVAGTSIAAPFVSGLAALAFSYSPLLSSAAAQSAITSTANRSSGQDVAYGLADAAALMRSLGYSAAPAAPAKTADPVISGSARDGQTLTVSNGSWTGSPTPSYAYAWARCDAGGAGCAATGVSVASYQLGAGDVGHTLRATVTATNSVGSASASVLSAAVLAVAPANTSSPTIGGALSVGSTLTASPGTWSGTAAPRITFAYQWQSSSDGAVWAAIGATSPSYTVTAAMVGRRLRVMVTASNSAGSATAYSASALVTSPPSALAAPSLSSATARLGDTLTASAGTWTGSPAPIASYQWQRLTDRTTWTSIAGATGSTYAAGADDVGRYLRIAVTATSSAGTAVAYSAAAGPVTAPPAAGATPTVSSASPRLGDTLTASPGTWSGSPAPTYSYQWERSTDSSSWSTIQGARSRSYGVGAAVLDNYLRVVVTASSSAGTASAHSNATARVSQAPVNSSRPTLSGGASPAVDGTVTVTKGGWTGTAPLSYSYRWQYAADCGSWSDIPGAASAGYVVTRSLVDACLRAVVTVQNTAGSATATTRSTARVLASPAVVAAPTIRVTLPLRAGSVLVAGPGSWSASPSCAYSYRWQYSTDGVTWTTVSGATGGRYTLAAAYLGDYVRVAVTATNSLGSATAYAAAVGGPAAA